MSITEGEAGGSVATRAREECPQASDNHPRVAGVSLGARAHSSLGVDVSEQILPRRHNLWHYCGSRTYSTRYFVACIVETCKPISIVNGGSVDEVIQKHHTNIPSCMSSRMLLCIWITDSLT